MKVMGMGKLSKLPGLNTRISVPKTFKVTASAPKVPVLKPIKQKTVKVRDLFGSEIKIANRRETGVTPKILHAYSNPARLIPKARTI